MPSTNSVSELAFHDPAWLLVLVGLPLLLWLRRQRAVPVWIVPFAAGWRRDPGQPPSKLPEIVALGGLVLVTIALARPQTVNQRQEIRREGYDIMLAVDLSRSMRVEDYRLNGTPVSRLQALKPAIEAFISQRPEDRVGLVVFSGSAYTLSPPTFNHAWLLSQLDQINLDRMGDGTAIGDGLALAITRLNQSRAGASPSHGSFVVLFTDGENNSGLVTPAEALGLAKDKGIPVYTFAIGLPGYAEIPYTDADGKPQREVYISAVDEGLLWKIANETGGAFYRGDNSGSLRRAFQNLDGVKKIELPPRLIRSALELFPWFAIPGLAVVLAVSVHRRGRAWVLAL